jgi:S1-C subfamily serine protease
VEISPSLASGGVGVYENGAVPPAALLNRGFYLTLILFLLGGCSLATQPTDVERTRSFQAYQFSQIDGQTLESFVRGRTAVILSGMPIAGATAQGETMTIDLARRSSESLEIGHACAIASDGYFLTADHCLEGSIHYLVWSDGRMAHIAEPRIVAREFDATTHLDLAVIHVDATLAKVFEWSDEGDLTAGRAAIAVGFRELRKLGEHRGSLLPMFLAGKITGVLPCGAEARIVRSDLPFRNGDSGGPLISADGKLLGVHSYSVTDWFKAPVAGAVRPDLGWVDRVLGKDRGVREVDLKLSLPATVPTGRDIAAILISL